MFIRDLQGNEYPLFTDFEHTDELNTNDSIRMKIPYDKLHGEFLSQTTDLEHWIIGDIVGINEYRIVYSKKITKGDSFYVDIIANPEVIERLDELRVYKRYDEYFEDVRFFNLVFADTPFTVVINETMGSIAWEGVGDGESKLSMFKRGIKRYGFEFEIVGNVVYLKKKLGNDTNYEFRYKLNAANIVKETDSQEFFTAIKGYGNYEQDENDIDGKALLKDTYISPLASVYGEKWAPPLRDGRVKVASTLRKEMERIVDESLKISFSADIYDLSRQGYDYQHTVLGDRVFLVDERIKEDVEVRVVKKEVKYSAKKEIIDLKLTFGTTSMTDAYKTSLQTTVKDFSEIMAGRKPLPFPALDITTRSMVTMIQDTTSEIVYDTNGQHFIEKNNPNNIMTMNSSGLFLSTDGGMTGTTAITARGITADAITTGTMYANRIQGGSLASNSGSMVWNLDKNQFNFYSGSTAHYWGSSDIQFHHFDNTINMEKNGVTAFLSFMTAIDDNYPAIVIGASEYGTTGGTSTFVGLKAQSAKATPLGYSQAEIIGDRVIFDSHGGSATTGSWVLETYRKDGDKVRSLYGRDLDLGYKYELGTISNRYENLWAKSLVGSMRLVSDSTSDAGSIFSMDLRNGFTFSNSGLSFYYDGKGYSFGWVVKALGDLTSDTTGVNKRIDDAFAQISKVNNRVDEVLSMSNTADSKIHDRIDALLKLVNDGDKALNDRIDKIVAG